jgi:hypothetical protein
MTKEVIAPLLIWLAALFSQTERLAAKDYFNIFGRDISKRLIAVLLIVTATFGLGWQIYLTRGKNEEVNKLKHAVSIANTKLFNEASGGTAIKEKAYIVDDEKPAVFEFTLNKDSYEPSDKIVLKEKVNEDNKEKVNILTGDEVDDLEAISAFDGKLYLITSHSNNKKGKPNLARQRLLEISLDPANRGEIIRSANNLRASILQKLNSDHLPTSYKNERNVDEVIQIEGLAIDEQGTAYFGLRTPLTIEGKYALVLSAPLLDLFSKEKEPQFKVFLLNLWYQNENDNQRIVPYGIVSLDYDVRTGKILIVGNSPEDSGYFSPILCQWNFAGEHKDAGIQNPACSSIPPYEVNGSTSKTSKIELLLLPAESDRVFMFLDTDDKGNGGQLSYIRSELGLAK